MLFYSVEYGSPICKRYQADSLDYYEFRWCDNRGLEPITTHLLHRIPITGEQERYHLQHAQTALQDFL